jgi:hypothetical protein
MTQLTKQEKENLEEYYVGEDDVKKCPDCLRINHIARPDCRFCGYLWVEKEPENTIPDEELCPECDQHMIYNEETEEWFCPIDHSPSIFEFSSFEPESYYQNRFEGSIYGIYARFFRFFLKVRGLGRMALLRSIQ